MPFDTFVIKRHTDNSTVNLNDVDRLVCERFNLPDVVIPDSVKILGVFAFGHSVIKSVRFPLGLRCEYARQFKDSHIWILYLSNTKEEYVSHPEMYGYLNAMYNADKIIYGYIDNEL